MNKRNKILLIIVSILVFLTTMFLTYAYFSINVSGNEDAELITVTTGTLQLQYSEGNNQKSNIKLMATLGETALYYTTDTEETQDGRRVYYYRGATEENHVIFAGFCWQIVRTNEDGSIRLRYNGEPNNGSCPVKGTQVYPTYVKNGETIYGYVKYNTQYNDNRYVGYMYGSTCTSYETCHVNEVNSTIKTFVDEWYEYAIASNSNYDNKVAISDFCNDRSLAVEAIEIIKLESGGEITQNGSGSGTELTIYGSYDKLYGEFIRTADAATLAQLTQMGLNPSVFSAKKTYKCPQENDILKLKAGLLTADELVFAGASMSDNNQNFHLYTNNNYWLMSPAVFNGRDARSVAVGSSGYVDAYGVDASWAALPVISLKADTQVNSGLGTNSSPWVVD